MKSFSYERASGVASACASAAEPTAKFIAGGTNLIDLMKLQIETPARLVDIGLLPLADIEETAEGGLRIAVNQVTRSLSMGLAAAPEDADAVIAREGVRLFLSAPAAERVRDRTLCAEITPTRSRFFLDP